MRTEEIKGGMMVRVKSGKVYKIGKQTDGSPAWAKHGPVSGEVGAVQWQVNDKHPEGRFFGPWRYLKIENIVGEVGP